METPFRWAFWGAGSVAEQVALDLRLVPNARLHAVGARRLEQAQAMALRHGVGRAVNQLSALLEDPEVDAVYLATPHHCHRDDALRCIAAGKPVLVEKPFALDRSEAEDIVAAARAAGIFVMEAMWMRFIPAVREARRIIGEGKLGAVQLLMADFAYPTPRALPRFWNAGQGGGALLDRGVYPISLALYLMGSAPVAVSGHAFRGAGGVDEHSAYSLRFANGALATLSAGLDCLGRNEASVCGSLGQMRFPAPFYKADRLEVRHHASPDTMIVGTPKAGSLKRHGLQRLRRAAEPLIRALSPSRVHRFAFAGYGYQFELIEVQHCVRAGLKESETMSLQESLDVMDVLDRLRRSPDWHPA